MRPVRPGAYCGRAAVLAVWRQMTDPSTGHSDRLLARSSGRGNGTGRASRKRLAIPILLALFGAGLLYGDGVITPAVSVLGAVEGLSEQNPNFADLVVPISAAILIGLFWMQRYGTHRIGSIFGW